MKPTYRDLNELLYERQRQGKPVSKAQLAKALDVWPSKLTTLLKPKSYRVSLNDSLVSKIAQVLNQPAEYVLELYGDTIPDRQTEKVNRRKEVA